VAVGLSAVEPTTTGVNELRPRLGKRSVGCLLARWSEDLRRTAGRSWIPVAEDRARWREVGEAYVQQWTNKHMMIMIKILLENA
jgi:hypothetical protein